MVEFVYNNKILIGRCIDFSYYGSVLFKKLFKENKLNCKVQVKRYIINEEDDNFSPYHYYIEIKTPRGKLIIDNCDCYRFWFYRDRFRPCGTIEKVSQREINYKVNSEKLDIADTIENTIMYHFENIKKNYMKERIILL
jgi:uncharacterized protein (DUF3820 family)